MRDRCKRCATKNLFFLRGLIVRAVASAFSDVVIGATDLTNFGIVDLVGRSAT
jgi:hypothetical protein